VVFNKKEGARMIIQAYIENWCYIGGLLFAALAVLVGFFWRGNRSDSQDSFVELHGITDSSVCFSVGFAFLKLLQ
jgi:hypothetical protein